MQFEELNLLYIQLLNTNKEIASFLEKKDYDEVFNKVSYKEKLIEKIMFLKKQVELKKSEKIALKSIISEIQALELKNIETLTKAKDTTKMDLQKIYSENKLTSKYSNTEVETGTLIDFSE